jgi:hypothetical protein
VGVGPVQVTASARSPATVTTGWPGAEGVVIATAEPGADRLPSTVPATADTVKKDSVPGVRSAMVHVVAVGAAQSPPTAV